MTPWESPRNGGDRAEAPCSLQPNSDSDLPAGGDGSKSEITVGVFFEPWTDRRKEERSRA